ncbi:hypothetical protein DIS09_02770 [Burkholderia pseudomallei]|nr:hypothetical protein DIS09_02770 [Burkholderia pseudomallei]
MARRRDDARLASRDSFRYPMDLQGEGAGRARRSAPLRATRIVSARGVAADLAMRRFVSRMGSPIEARLKTGLKIDACARRFRRRRRSRGDPRGRAGPISGMRAFRWRPCRRPAAGRMPLPMPNPEWRSRTTARNCGTGADTVARGVTAGGWGTCRRAVGEAANSEARRSCATAVARAHDASQA